MDHSSNTPHAIDSSVNWKNYKCLPQSNLLDMSEKHHVDEKNCRIEMFKIAGKYPSQWAAANACEFLQANGYPVRLINIINPFHPLPNQLELGGMASNQQAGVFEKQVLRFMVIFGVLMLIWAFSGELDGMLRGFTSLNLGIFGMTTLLGASSMLFHKKSLKELQFDAVVQGYAKKRYWTLLVHASSEREARFALRLIEHTSCKHALVCGPLPLYQ